MIYQCNFFFLNIDINLVVLVIIDDLISPICTPNGPVLLDQIILILFSHQSICTINYLNRWYEGYRTVCLHMEIDNSMFVAVK